MGKFKHGLASRSGRHPLYHIWHNILNRCYLNSCPKFKNYGLRGISVCQEWRDSFESFYDFVISIGWQQGKSIDRRNNDGNYEPGNIRITDVVTQNNNRTSNRHLVILGESKTMAEWGRDPRLKVCYNTFRNRVNMGWNPEEAFTLPLTRKKGKTNGSNL